MNLLKEIKGFFFWQYGRKTWRFDFLCAAYIAALIFLPLNSNGWFNEGETVTLSDESAVTLHRHGTEIYVQWDKDSKRPGDKAMSSFINERFGAKSQIVNDTERGEHALRIIPGGKINLLP